MADRSSVRVNHDGTLVVPPFECAWPTGEGYEFRNGSGCVMFEAKGETDVTLIFRPTPGTKRWQPLCRSPQTPSLPAPAVPLAAAAQLPAASIDQPSDPTAATPSSSSGLVGVVEPNYTVILGSHRNSCLKIEKNGSTVRQVQGVPGARVSSKTFQPYWINYHQGIITVGTGEPCVENISQQWVDHDPINNLTNVGFSCWDRHVSYRNIVVQPGIAFTILGRQQSQGDGAAGGEELGPVSLFRQCTQVLVASLGQPGASVFQVVQLAEILLPSTRTLYRACLDYMARNFHSICRGNHPGHPSNLSTEPQHSPPSATSTATCGHPDAFLAHRSHSAPVDAEALPAHLLPSQSEPYARHSQEVPTGNRAPDQAPSTASMVVDDSEFAELPATILSDLLLQNTIAVTEKQIFDAVVWWAQGSSNNTAAVSDSQQGCSADSAAATAGAGVGVGVGDGQHTQHTETEEQVFAMDADGTGRNSLDTTRQHTQHGVQHGTQHAQHSQQHDPACIAGSGPGRPARAAAEISAVLSLIRYTLMTQQELHSVLSHPLVSSSPSLLSLVEEALGMDGGQASASTTQVGTPGRTAAGGLFAVENRRLLHASSSSENTRASTARFQRRLLPSSHECAYICDGDQNGVLHFIGSLYGTQAWVNPVLARRVDIKASSPAGRHTDPKALAGNNFLRTNWAGPRYVNGVADTWWMVDLGISHSLIITYYTMRQDGSTDYVRSWVLQGSSCVIVLRFQGSNDGAAWVDLQHHTKDPTLKRPGQYMSWPVLGPAAQAPYRCFRLVLTGPTSSPHQPYHFPLSHLELYGYLQRLEPPN